MAEAEIDKEKFNYVNTHGTSTQLNDVAETLAVKNVFGEHAYKLAINSTKSCLGHSLGASGAIELIVCAKSIEKGMIHPTANLQQVAEDCDPKMDFVPGPARQIEVKVTLSNSLGFGGHNCSLIVGKV